MPLLHRRKHRKHDVTEKVKQYLNEERSLSMFPVETFSHIRHTAHYPHMPSRTSHSPSASASRHFRPPQVVTRTACCSQTPLSPGRCWFSPAFESSRVIFWTSSCSSLFFVPWCVCSRVSFRSCRSREVGACAPPFCRCAPMHVFRHPLVYAVCVLSLEGVGLVTLFKYMLQLIN